MLLYWKDFGPKYCTPGQASFETELQSMKVNRIKHEKTVNTERTNKNV